jgi:methylated-DNA-protein-cysteine methyltransferase-like protein
MSKPIKLSEKNKDFFEQVYQVARLIPKGRVTSYGAIARYLGSGRGARMVGWAMNACMNRPDVPAHRVVNRLGMLTGKMHFATPTAMQGRLEAEGITIENDKIKDFNTLNWEPAKELKL